MFIVITRYIQDHSLCVLLITAHRALHFFISRLNDAVRREVYARKTLLLYTVSIKPAKLVNW